MTVEDLLGRLEGVRGHVKRGVPEYVAVCPVHDDRVASLSVGVGADERILLCCHAGCAAGDIVAALGLTLADLFPERREPAAPNGCVRVPGPAFGKLSAASVLPRARVVAPPVSEEKVVRWRARCRDNAALLGYLGRVKGWSWTTLDALGVGFDGQRLTFPVRTSFGRLTGVLRYLPGGDPKMLASRGVSRELWPHPWVAANLPVWAKRKKVMFLVEGEPDVVSAFEIGLPAVALPGAGVAWRDSWTLAFTGATVVVVVDCDEPGRALGERVRVALDEMADVRVVDLDPARVDGHDLGAEVQATSCWGMLGRDALRRRLLGLAGLTDGLTSSTM